MAADGCRPLREMLGAYALGHLDPAGQAAVAAHLEQCPACAAEAVDLAETAALLDDAGPVPEGAPPLPEGLGERVVAVVGADRKRRLARRRLSFAAAAAVVVIALAAVAVPRLGGEPEEDLEQVALVGESGARATATLRPWDWGTGIELEATGLEPGETYAVWFANAAGERLSAGTFVALADGQVRCRMTTAMLRPAAAALGVSTVDDGNSVLLTTLE
jgi:predicted anti-sigma-YlaC factor YlaD